MHDYSRADDGYGNMIDVPRGPRYYWTTEDHERDGYRMPLNWHDHRHGAYAWAFQQSIDDVSYEYASESCEVR